MQKNKIMKEEMKERKRIKTREKMKESSQINLARFKITREEGRDLKE